MKAALIILLCAALNRMRGDDRWMRHGFDHRAAKRIPGRALWYVSPIVGVAAGLYTGSAVAGVIWGVGYLLWGTAGWSHLYGLGRFEPADEETPVETWLIELSCGSIHAAFALRQLFAAPAYIAAAWWTGDPLVAFCVVPFAALAVGAYEVAWRLRPDNPIWLAELMVGALWGVAILLT